MSKALHKLKKKPHFKKPEKELRRCQLLKVGLQDGPFRYEPGSVFLFEQKYDGKGQPYMCVYRSEDVKAFWPFSLSAFYRTFKIIR